MQNLVSRVTTSWSSLLVTRRRQRLPRQKTRTTRLKFRRDRRADADDANGNSCFEIKLTSYRPIYGASPRQYSSVFLSTTDRGRAATAGEHRQRRNGLSGPFAKLTGSLSSFSQNVTADWRRAISTTAVLKYMTDELYFARCRCLRCYCSCRRWNIK